MDKRHFLGAAAALLLVSGTSALARDNAPTTSTSCECLCVAYGGRQEIRQYESSGFACSQLNGGRCTVYDEGTDLQIEGQTMGCGPAGGGSSGAASAPLLDGLLERRGTGILRL
jgi:hypothetical protein